MKHVTSLSIPENLLQFATQLSPANRAFIIRATTGAFVKSPSCTALFITSIPVQDKIKVHSFNLPTPGDRATHRAWKKIAKVVTPRASVSQLVSAAFYWKQQIAA